MTLRQATAIALTLTLTACHGVFDGLYDEAVPDDSFAEGFRSDANHHVLMLNATSYDSWIYVDLHSMTIERRDIPDALTAEKWDGESGITYQLVHGSEYAEQSFTPTDPQSDPESWDLAIHHFDVRTNGGSVAVAPSSNLALASAKDFAGLQFTPDAWSDHQVIVDMKEMMGYKIGYQNSAYNPVLSQWATMDFSTPPPVYSASGDVYYLRLADGTAAAIQLRSYISPVGTKGYLTIDLIYPL